MATLTRRQSQALTREKLLEAGRELLAEERGRDLSVRTLTARAGMTSGAFYANFPSRTEFLGELCARVTGEFLETLRAATRRAAQLTPEQSACVYTEWARQIDEGLAASMLRFGMLAHSDEQFARRYEPIATAFGRNLAGELRFLFSAYGLTPQISFEQMASGFMTMWMGQLMFRSMPGHERYTDAIALFLSEMFRAARPEERTK